MRSKYPKESLREICELFGVCRQSFYDASARKEKISMENAIVIELVGELRQKIPMIGTRKLLFLLEPQLQEHGIKLGRDLLFDLLRASGLLIRRRKRMVKTTDSYHWFKRYQNLTVGLILTGPEQLWVSDITYIRMQSGFSYLSLITDAYSRKIVGFELYPTLEAEGPLNALSNAVASRKSLASYALIHHSDRGIQYCSSMYIEMLSENNISPSMTQSGSPYENALAERMNGILKHEFHAGRLYQNFKEAKKSISRIISIYNDIRPHSSLDFLTPNQVHEGQTFNGKRWKNRKRMQPVVV
jgi:putative transposase